MKRCRSITLYFTFFFTVVVGVTGLTFAQDDGTLVAWGNNQFGQCDVPDPNTEFVTGAGGYYHSLALKDDRSIVGWGLNDYGQCDTPLPNADFVAVAAGSYHSLGLKDNGSIVTWGDSRFGLAELPIPNSGFVDIAGGHDHSLALRADSTIVGWGRNSYGECDVPEPNTGFVSIAVGGGRHSLGLKADSTIVAWGRNDYGETEVPEPNTGFVSIAGGTWHSLGLKSDGSVVAWGLNSSGQCDVPSQNIGFVAIAAGDKHSLGLQADGSVIVWGGGSDGQTNLPEPNERFVSVAAGELHNLAIKGSPFVARVVDVPDDQGGAVEIYWTAHTNDALDDLESIVAYEAQRMESGAWVTFETVDAVGSETYQTTTGTDDVFIVGQPEPFSWYRVLATTSAPDLMFYSSIDSGYSIDNIPPPKPDVLLVDDPSFRFILWSIPDIPDLGTMCVYRGTESGFVPDVPIECPTIGQYEETHLGWYFYRVQFTDIHGNLGEFSDELHGQYPTAVGDLSPRTFSLGQNIPNPFNPKTTIAFDLPKQAAVNLRVYDVKGQLVRVLLDGEIVAEGRQEAVWNGRDANGRIVPAGVYFYRLEADSFSETKRMVLMK